MSIELIIVIVLLLLATLLVNSGGNRVLAALADCMIILAVAFPASWPQDGVRDVCRAAAVAAARGGDRRGGCGDVPG
jgi:hypothetical protein